MIGRPIQNATMDATRTYAKPIQNIALGMVTPNSVKFPDRCHRIAVNEITETTASIAPNSSVLPVVLFGVLGSGPTPAVKMSISDWMRWSGLSIRSSMKRPR